ncbi:MAG TPA: fumarylacetoacetate hydrolase family protein [Puia sp.]|jgi:2-dehydro-3-deoxy-D-arabinonate dehydratase|nr:fumarylacetoacetate hydrolase family protein [Puia sp.]
MKLYRTLSGNIIEHENGYYSINLEWNEIVNRDKLYSYLENFLTYTDPISDGYNLIDEKLCPPIGDQEVWAAGVTYLRSKTARMEESSTSGSASFYDHVYDAVRPELFYKSSPGNVVGSNDIVHIRKDSIWNVPEPELTLFINKLGNIQGYTIGNDMSSRSIEGENPLYLPQAKVYERSAALGPCLLVLNHPVDPNTSISMRIIRNEKEVYNDSVSVRQMKRKHNELVDFLYSENTFPSGCYLMTGTCLVPPSEFTLLVNDEILITIDGIGLLRNIVGTKK